MRWITLFSGMLVVAYLGAGTVDRYWSGVAFTKSWWPALLVPVLLIAFLGLLVGCIWLLVSVIRRRTKPIWLLLLMFPVLYVALKSVPTPGFVDGMAHRLQRDFSTEEFLGFADLARVLKVDWTGPASEVEDGMNALKNAFPGIMALSEIEPRITLAESHVDIFYGSALVKHWGVRIMDKDAKDNPFASDDGTYAMEALPSIWVYHLPY